MKDDVSAGKKLWEWEDFKRSGAALPANIIGLGL